MKTLIKWTLWQRRKSILGWSFGSAFLILINLIFYPSFKNQASELQKSFESLPPAAVQLLGGSTDFFSPIGFLNSQIYFIMLPLLLGVLAISLGHKIISQEEQDGTIQLILSRPISRKTYLASKAVSGLIIISIVTVLSLLVTLICGRIVHLEVGVIDITLATIACYLLILSLGSVAFMLSAFGKTRIISVPTATAFALGGYVISSLTSTISWLTIPSKVFPFHYYKPAEILGGDVSYRDLLFFIVVIVVSYGLSLIVFSKRDLD